MKKIIILLIMCLLVVGCGKNTETYVTKRINKKYDKSTGYKLNGELEINNNDEVYNYDVTVSYDKKNDYYKISIINKSNDFKQMIIKNEDGVFLFTPSLNKSFKFNSKWPYNNSQIYLYDTIINDIKNDNNKKYDYKNNKHIYYTKVNYPNNSKLSKQKIVFDKNDNLKLISVYDNDDRVCMQLSVEKVEFSPRFGKNHFKLDNNVDIKKSEKTMSIDDVVYPVFLPSGTKLVEEKRVNKDNGERVIMTYDGEKNFLLVEETVDVFGDFTVIPCSGEPFQLMDTIGVMTDNSLSWTSGNRDFYIVSDVMDKDELVEIAQSIVGVSSLK